MYFPLFVDLTEKEILVIGAGAVAERRIQVLMRFGGYITVVAPEISRKIREFNKAACVGDGDAPAFLSIEKRPYVEKDLDRKDLVIAATDDVKLNEQIALACKKRGIAVNVASSAALCDFQFPSVVVDEPLVVGINASGADHALVKETRKKIERALSEDSVYEA